MNQSLATALAGKSGNTAIQSYIPPYVSEGSLQLWNSSDPCPLGYTCSSMGNASLGAFSCDEMARIALVEYGFGNVLAGTYCPEGETEVLNCGVGGYCPDSKTRIPCPAGKFCPYKTYEPTIRGGSTNCARCPEGAEKKSYSKTQLIIQVVIFVIMCLLVMIKIIKRKVSIDQQLLKKKLHLERTNRRTSSKTEVKVEQEKYARLRPKLEVISTRLDKIRQDKHPAQAQDHNGASGGDAQSPARKGLETRKSILYLDKSGNIIFEANELFDVLDTSRDGVLSFSEINEVLCLSDEQLRVFIANMRDRMPADYSPAQHDKVSRLVFVKNFLDVIADASQLEPTAEEAEDLFNQILEEAGNAESGEVPYEELYNSYMSSFLSDLQIYAIIKKFKQEEGGKETGISKHDFVKLYPLFLSEVVSGDQDGKPQAGLGGGLDVAFENLSLTVTVGGKQVNVVDSVTGRLRSNTMTAVMGGSGSGKSSLLNALCGRAYYGEVTGAVKINGNDSLIEEHTAVIGFVPQDDIVYPDLTVRENLLYSGRLQLPSGTSKEEIEELADTTMAALGLSRIANSLVGDATRRGISGGEKKRVNIGLELMKRPKILFLDEPTSGLDSRSAFVVMNSLGNLVNTQGMTVASVIHQPRTDIYDMFDSLFLLGVGGRTVYHGPATEARSYFENLGFQMRSGDSQADWFLDISSGDIESGDIEAGATNDENNAAPRKSRLSIFGLRFEVSLLHGTNDGIGFVMGQLDGAERGQFEVKEVGNIRYATLSAEHVIQVGDKVVGINGHGLGDKAMEDVDAILSDVLGDSTYVFVELIRQVAEDCAAEAEDDHHLDREKSFLISKPVGKEDGALVKARVTREKLYRHFLVYFENLPSSQRATFYGPPEAFALPETPKAVSSWLQFIVQLRRNCLLSWRNRDSRIIDFGILLIAVFAMTLLGGVTSSTWDSDPVGLIWIKWVASPKDASEMLLPMAFWYAFKGVNALTNYAMMVGLIISVLIGLNATKVITDKRLEFFREAQSGTSVTAFYIAATVTATIGQGFGAVSGSLLAYLVSQPSSSYLVFLWNFFMLSWLSVSWSILLAIIVPQNSVSTVVGFFNAFFGLLFCGKVEPGVFKKLYANPALAVFSGFVSPLRFFVEGFAVSEAKCLPEQSGYTVDANSFTYPEFNASWPYSKDLTYMARTDLDTAITQSCDGWFWWVPAAFAVGITVRIVGGVAINFSGRSQQGKKSFRTEIVDDFRKCRAGSRPTSQSFILISILVFLLFAGFFALSCWLILRENPQRIQF